jgi:transcriptional regulator with XRE-family HTH domain
MHVSNFNIEEFRKKRKSVNLNSAKIRTLRIERGLTQSELAKRLGLTPTSAGSWESKPSSVRYDTAEAIAAELMVHPREIINRNVTWNTFVKTSKLLTPDQLTEVNNKMLAMIKKNKVQAVPRRYNGTQLFKGKKGY